MAIVTRDWAYDAGGAVTWQIDYDDADPNDLQVLTLRCINQTNQRAWGEAYPIGQPQKRIYREPPANQTTNYAIPQQAAQAWKFTLRMLGNRLVIDGIQFNHGHPA